MAYRGRQTCIKSEIRKKIRIWFLIKIYDVIIKINRIHLGLEFTNAICN